MPDLLTIQSHILTKEYGQERFKKIISEQKAKLERHVVEIIKTALPQNSRCMDYGCGFGNLLRHLLSEGYDCIGVDGSKEAFNTLEKDGIKAINAWDLSEIGGSFDCIILIDVFCYLGAPYDTLKKCYDLLTPKGMLIMRLTNKYLALEVILKFKLKSHIRDNICKRIIIDQFHMIQMPSLERIIRKVGFNSSIISGKATTAPWGKLSIYGKIIYPLSTIIEKVTFGKILISPGVLLIARK
jgi:cyclopropane fatty-acyl-phospholipid synthase-like methyltransferase